MARYHLLHGLLIALLLALGRAAEAVDHFFTFTLEDDFFAGRDYGYTGGMQVGWTRTGANSYDDLAPGWLAAAAHPLWLSQNPQRERSIAYRVGIMAYTPRDISTRNPPADDLPYSGLLYGQLVLQAADARRADQAYLLLGMVGPISGASQVQKISHHLTDSQPPEGWSQQLEDEPVFKFGAGRKWRTWSRDTSDSPWGMDLVTDAEIGAGTWESTADLALSWRYGQDLARSFPAAGLLPDREANPLAGQAPAALSFFITVMARYQPNAIYVQGNTFGGHQTDLALHQEQYWSSAGLLWSRGHWGYEFAMVHSTKIFKGPNASQTFGSLNVSYRY